MVRSAGYFPISVSQPMARKESRQEAKTKDSGLHQKSSVQLEANVQLSTWAGSYKCFWP